MQQPLVQKGLTLWVGYRTQIMYQVPISTVSDSLWTTELNVWRGNTKTVCRSAPALHVEMFGKVYAFRSKPQKWFSGQQLYHGDRSRLVQRCCSKRFWGVRFQKLCLKAIFYFPEFAIYGCTLLDQPGVGGVRLCQDGDSREPPNELKNQAS